ncbi:hypothetical protein FRB96_000288 [Tulasnella sp. 330]|nr:hypothetical protein FRB96_000288 [Tulasnella sp. 330]KAG8882265.1 hypothetical protein FRB97_008468 [Tulasnella sp. 331]KAG8886872.1 hypothetical protein FRB98_000898 [Tulasnella sp. 332]
MSAQATRQLPSRSSNISVAEEVTSGPPLHFFDDPSPDTEQETAVASPLATTVELEDGQKQAIEIHEKDGQKVLYVEFEPGDPRDPFSFSKGRKWAMTWTACVYTFFTAYTLSAFAIGVPSLRRELGFNATDAALGLSVYAWGFACAPLILAPFSEEWGRNPLYLGSAFVFTLFFIPVALAQNLTTIIIARIIAGAAGSTGSTMVGGSLADIWRTAERGLPMSIFALMAFLGTGAGALVMAPVEMNSKLGWRWIQWISIMIGTLIWTALFLAMKETRSAVLLTRIAKDLRKTTGDQRYRARAEDERPPLKDLIIISLTRPMWLLISEPLVTAFSLWIGFAWGVLYGLVESIPYVFQTLYGFNQVQIGLVFLAIMFGSVLGFVGNLWQEKVYTKYFPTKGPEARLYGACAAGVLFPVGCFIYAWTSFSHVHWIAPVIGITIVSWGIFIIYLSVFNYLADSYLIYASSALAAQSFVRNISGGGFPLFTDQIYEKLTPPWAASLFGFIGCLLGVVPFLFMRYGARIRAASPLAKRLAEANLNSPK